MAKKIVQDNGPYVPEQSADSFPDATLANNPVHPEYRTHTVEVGDTIQSIAAKYDVRDMQGIFHLNQTQLDPSGKQSTFTPDRPLAAGMIVVLPNG